MFIGVRDIRFAMGRFALICGVIAMMTLMVVALSTLTSGLQDQSISAVTRLPGQTVVLAAPGDGQTPSLAQSDLDASTVHQVAEGVGGDAAELGVRTTRLSTPSSAAPVTIFGADERLMPDPVAGKAPADGQILLARELADDVHVAVGDEVTVGTTSLRIAGIGAAGEFAHTPVAYTTPATWRVITDGGRASAVVLWGDAPSVPGTTSVAMSSLPATVPGYTSERGSLIAMQLLLLVISALVVGAFFAVWTIQRLRDLAVVRALGASRAYLLRDGLGQAALVLLVGESLGTLCGLALVSAVSGLVPISVTPAVILLPVVASAALGILGALFAVRRVTTVDPLVALAR